MIQKYSLGIVVATFLLAGTACVGMESIPPTAPESIALAPTFASPLTSSVQPATVTPTLQQPCCCSSKTPNLTIPQNAEELLGGIQNYLSQGGDPTAIPTLIPNLEGERKTEIKVVDLNNDGVAEVIVAGMLHPQGRMHDEMPEGMLFIYYRDVAEKCYRVYQAYYDKYVWAVDILAVDRLIGTAFPQVAVKYNWAGSTRVDGLLMVGWDGRQWKKFFATELESIDKVQFTDKSGAGQKDIMLEGYRSHQKADATWEQWRVTETYEWDGSAYKLQGP